MPQVAAVVFDLGDVLMSWQPRDDCKVAPKTLKRAMTSKTWHDLERGRLTEDECYQQLAIAMDISANDMRDAIDRAKLSLRPDPEMVEILRQIRSLFKDTKIYLASNISKEHWKHVRSLPDIDWKLFDGLFVSAEMGMRKPDLCFFANMIRRVGLRQDPSSIVFMDDRLENIVAAQASGLTAFQFKDADTAISYLKCKLADPVDRGMSYLQANARSMWSVTDGIEIKENFAQLLILEACKGRYDLVSLKSYPLLWNYFQERPVVSTTQFPDDFDTTSIAYTVLEKAYFGKDTFDQVLDIMLKYQDCDGLPMVYADTSRPRVDPVVCVHILTFFHLNGRSWQLEKAWSYVLQILNNKAYENGTYYYSSADYFLYSLSRLVHYSHERGLDLPDSTQDQPKFLELFRARCRQRVNTGPADALSLAIRIIASLVSGIPKQDLELDAEKLGGMQECDGGWPICEIYKIPSTKAGIGNRGVVTAFAIKALRMMYLENRSLPKDAIHPRTWARSILDRGSGLIGRFSMWEVALASGLGTMMGVAGTLCGMKLHTRVYGRGHGGVAYQIFSTIFRSG